MILSTTFALAQRHERREMNENNKMTSSRWDELFSQRKSCLSCRFKKEMVLLTTFALAQRHERRERGIIDSGQLTIDSSYLAFARTITRRARVRQLAIDN